MPLACQVDISILVFGSIFVVCAADSRNCGIGQSPVGSCLDVIECDFRNGILLGLPVFVDICFLVLDCD